MRRQADDGRGRIEIVEADQRRADRRRDLRDRAERDHVALAVAHHQVLDVARRQAELRIRLRIDLEGAAELVELVDVGRAQVGRQRREDLVGRDVQGLGLDPVHLDVELRHHRAERRTDALQRALRLRIGDDGAGDRLQLAEVGIAVAQLDLHGEAGGVADALDRRRRDHQDPRLRRSPTASRSGRRTASADPRPARARSSPSGSDRRRRHWRGWTLLSSAEMPAMVMT